MLGSRVHVISVFAIAVAFSCTSCDDNGPFELHVWANVYSDADTEVWVEGEHITGSGTITLTQEPFDTYEAALGVGITVETRTTDGTIVDHCIVYAGACQDNCVPSRESVGVCTLDDGSIRLNTWDCPCDDGVSDWFCDGPCSYTGPQ